MVMGHSPNDLPLGTFLMWNKELEDYLDSQIEMRRVAVEEAISNFWEAIN
jgi:hypothetical protein